MFPRVLLQPGKDLPHPALNGSGVTNPAVFEGPNAAATLTPGQLIGGVILATITAARAYTVPTKAALDAALPNMNQGDTHTFFMKGTGGAITVTGVTGVTVVGGLQIDGVMALGLLRKNADLTYTITMIPMAAS